MPASRPAVLWSVAVAALVLGNGMARAETVVGVAGPMSGSLAIFGKQMQDGAAQAVADINAAGGVNGEQLSLQAMDDECNPKTADAVANQLAGRGAVMVAGHLCLNASLAASSVYAANKIIEISPGTTWPAYTDTRPGPGIYRLAGRDDRQGPLAAAYIVEHFANAPVAIVDDRSPYGKELADAMRRAMNAAGKREAFIEEYEPGQRDFTGMIERLQGANIGVLYIGGYPAEAGLIARQIKDAGLSIRIIGGDALVTNEYHDIAKDAADGTLITFAPDPRENVNAATVVKSFRDRGIEPEGYVLPAYAAIQIWAQAANSTGKNDFDSVVEALDNNRFTTVVGEVTFDNRGDMSLPGFTVYEWRGGRLDGPSS